MLKSLLLVAALLVSGSAMATSPVHHYKSEYVTCESNDYKYNSCRAWGISRVRHVRLVQQLSKTRCQRGYNWRASYMGVEVWDGCRGTFEVTGR